MSPFSSPAVPEPIARELESDEQVLWQGRPDPRNIRKKAIPMALFSLLGGFCLLGVSLSMADSLWSEFSAGKTPDVFSAGFLLAFLAMSAMLFFRVLVPWTETAKAQSIFYALTNLRALIVIEGSKRGVTSVWAEQFELKRRGNAHGDLVLLKELGGEDSGPIKIGFFGIENPQDVERMAREVQLATIRLREQGQ